MSTEQVKTISLVANNRDLVDARRRIAAAAIGNSVRLLSVEERPKRRSSTSLEITVAGHPKRVREFHDDVRGGNGGGGYWWMNPQGPGDDPFALDSILTDLVVAGTSAAVGKVWKKWQGRHDPPLVEGEVSPATDDARTVVHWTWEQGSSETDAEGPMRVSIYFGADEEPLATKEWPDSVKRSEALAYAQERGFSFAPQDLPDE